jgi:hypothetical protein
MKLNRIFLALLLCSAANAEQWQTPKLIWGEPDLQGTWTTATVTTLERDKAIDRLVVSEQQALAIENFAAGFAESIDELPEGDLPAGKSVGGYNSVWMDPGTKVLRVDGKPRSSIITEPEDGHVPYTLSGKAKMWWGLLSTQKRNNPEELLLGDRCVVGFGSSGGPPMLPVLYNNNYRFVQSPNTVVIMVEMNHAARTIRIGGKPLPPEIRPWLGDSIGYWDGDTLVVETTQFHPQQSVRAAIKHRLYIGTDTKVVERFTRVSEKEINYQFTIEDEDIYTQPWQGELTFTPSDGQIYEYACHEGNYSLPGILAGARKADVNGLNWIWSIIKNPPI